MSHSEAHRKTEKKSVREQLDRLQNELIKMKESITHLNLRASILNIDLTSIHDPAVTGQMKEGKDICDGCVTRCNSRAIKQIESQNNKLNLELVVSEMEE